MTTVQPPAARRGCASRSWGRPATSGPSWSASSSGTPVSGSSGLAARNREGLPVGDAFAHLSETGHRIDGELPESSGLDAVFVALPHGQSAAVAPTLLERGLLVVDLGSDFRLSDPADYPTWYGFEHPTPELLPGGAGLPATRDRDAIPAAVYGLPELHRSALAGARLIASPGCYPTATLLALAPLARRRADRATSSWTPRAASAAQVGSPSSRPTSARSTSRSAPMASAVTGTTRRSARSWPSLAPAPERWRGSSSPRTWCR